MAQNTNYTPTKKVTAGTLAGAVSIVLVTIAGQLGVEVSPEVASSVTTLLAALAAYMKREGYLVLEGDVRATDLDEREPW